MAILINNRTENDSWATPDFIIDRIETAMGISFKGTIDPCPFDPNFEVDGSAPDFKWSNLTFLNPPYHKGKNAFLEKAMIEAENCKTIVMILPASNETVIMQKVLNHRNCKLVWTPESRIPFVGVTSKGVAVNYHLRADMEAPEGLPLGKAKGAHTSQIVVLDGGNLISPYRTAHTVRTNGWGNVMMPI